MTSTTTLPVRPAGAIKATCKVSGACVFLYEARGVLFASGYTAKGRRAFAYRFATATRRETYARDFLANQKAAAERAEADRKARNQPHTLKVGSILCASWGYDQTNVDWFQVVAIRGQNTVALRPIAADVEHRLMNCGRSLPKVDDFTGPAFDRRVNMQFGEPSVRVARSATARVWDGKAAYCSWGR